jgi:hypothetical protein
VWHSEGPPSIYGHWRLKKKKNALNWRLGGAQRNFGYGNKEIKLFLWWELNRGRQTPKPVILVIDIWAHKA